MSDGACQPRDPGPDARSLLANERTMLAWVRTALTFVAVGIGVLQFGDAIDARQLLAGVLLAAGAASGVVGLARHRRADTEIRSGALPPRSGPAAAVMAGAVVLVAVVSLVALLVSL